MFQILNLHIQGRTFVDILGVVKLKIKNLKLKFILAFIASFVGIFSFKSVALAQEQFTVDATVTYNVQDSGNTSVTHDITLTNNFSTLYATTYTLSLQNIDVSNASAYTIDPSGNKQSLSTDIAKNGETTSIKISFSDAIVGKGASRHFFVTYQNSSFAVRTGEIWEVTIPKLDDKSSFRNYTVILNIPASFGLEAYMSPKPSSFTQSDTGKTYTFTRDQVTQGAINAGFGPFQVFSFTLSYHLENPLSISSQTQIALPPDTAFQKIYFSSIDPKPQDVTIDPDGNWLATYKLTPKQRIDVKVAGSVQIFSGARPFPKPSQDILSANLKETQYWQINDPLIKNLAQRLKTPRAIYDYVSQNLKYDFARVQPNVERLGAVKALQNPDQAICMEYTDTFIAIARAAGIPAREINGYAYTENPQLQPLSLVADVLHAWPEYYDKTAGVWIPIDPTWASTTGGENFFDKLDLRHFTFVIHGFDSTKPYAPGSYKLGPNPQKDVFVSFGKLPNDRTSTPVINIESKRTIPFIGTYLSIKVNNPGPVALYGLTPTVYFDSLVTSKYSVAILPPYGNYAIQLKVPFSLLGKDTPEVVKITANDSFIEIPTNKSQVVLISLVSLFALFVIAIFLILVRLRKITFVKLSAKISSIYARLFGKGPEIQS